MERSNFYPNFEPNQILTSTHLNNLRNYLDEENRLTRIRLFGVGAACGLKAQYKSSTKTITVSYGYGLTTDGYLIEVPETTIYAKYREYKDPGDPAYAPWLKNETQISLLEILPGDTAYEGAQSLSGLDVKGKALVLFLEFRDEELKSCVGNTCDNKGKRRVFTVRPLLIDKDNLHEMALESIISRDEKLEEITIKRLSAEINLKDIGSYDDLANKGYLPIVNDYKKKISDALIEAHGIYSDLLGLNCYDLKVINDLKKKNFSSDRVQYAYDFLKDLVLAYNEFRAAAYELKRECLPAVPEFPRHLMLGRLSCAGGTEEEKYRNVFIPAPLVPGGDEKILKAKWLFERILGIAEGFDVALKAAVEDIRVTPTSSGRLSDMSIPYYYSNTAELSAFWNPDLRFRGKSAYQLSYNEDQYNSDRDNFIARPLDFNHDRYSSYRVEGPLRQDCGAALGKINEIIKTKNLSFDVIVLTLGNDAFTSGMPHICMWHDLQADYLELRSVLLCLSAEVLSRYEQFLKDIDGDYEKSRDIAQIKKLAGAMDALLPQCMEDFDFTGFGDAYKALLLALIVEKLYLEDYLNKLIYERSDVASIDEVQRWQSLLGQGRITLETFTGNCLYVKLLTLYYTYTQRTEYLKNHHPFIFRNFVEEYPGLEHEPVNEGGTYILLCHKEGGGDYIVVADFSLPYKIDCCCHVPLCDESLKLPPVATDDYAETVRGATVEIVGPGNDYSLANDKIVIVDYPKEEGGTDKGGTVKLKGKNNIFSYKPPKDFTGIDTFAYTIRNEAELESSATVTVLVREKYEKHIKAADDLAATERMTPVLIDVLANDRIYEKTALILPGDTSYLGAKLTIEDKKIKYVPVREGKDSFKYRLVDEGRKEESEAEVTLIVYCCECLEVVHQDKSAEIYVLNDLEKEMKADLKLFTTDIEKVSAQIVTEKKGTATVKEGIIYYVPPGGFAGRDSFGYRIDQKEKGYRRSCHVKVVVLSEGGEVAPPSCEMPDLSYAVNGTEAGEFVVDFSAKPETDHVKVTGVENLTLAEFKINRRSEKSIHIAWLKPFTSFSFTYTGIDTRTGAECEGTIALVSKKIFTIPERDLVAIEGKYVDIIPSDPRLKYNVESVGTFFDDVNNKYEANPDNFMAGSENTAITREFAGVFDALVDNATDISKAIEVSGATPELTKKRELNLELMNSSLSGYLRTLGAEDKDLKATDGTSEYIATGLKESISRLDAEDKAVVTENMTAIVTENPEKKVLNKNIKLLM